MLVPDKDPGSHELSPWVSRRAWAYNILGLLFNALPWCWKDQGTPGVLLGSSFPGCTL